MTSLPETGTSLARSAEHPVLVVDDLRISFDDGRTTTEILHGVDFELRPGRCVALVGESGSGKSITARALAGLLPPNAQVHARRLLLEDVDLTRLSEREWRRIRGARIGFVHQDAMLSLDPLRTAGQEIAETLHTHRVVQRSDVRARTLSLMSAVGLADPERRARQYAHELSGGQRQRVLLASAIAAHPAVLIADEPTTALDVTVQAQVLALLRARKEQGDALLMISHDLAVVAELADEVLVMRDGHVVERGPTSGVLAEPRHSYTRQLLRAIPSTRTRGRSLVTGEQVPPAARAGDEVVVARDLSVRHPDPSAPGDATPPAVDGVSFELRRGETLGVVGESGSGKTTLARLVLGVLKPDHGEIAVLGRAWSGVPERRRGSLRGHIQLIAQDPLGTFDPRYSVGAVIGESLDRIGVHGSARTARIRELLDNVRLPTAFIDRHPRTLSGGQRQRVAIARALAPDPAVIVADEAVSALDVSVQAQIIDLLDEVQREHGTGVMFISHDLGVIGHLADRILVMKDGRVVEQGDATEILRNPDHDYTRRLLESIPALPVSPPQSSALAQSLRWHPSNDEPGDRGCESAKSRIRRSTRVRRPDTG